MIGTVTAKIINILPGKFVTYVSKKIIDRYLTLQIKRVLGVYK